MTGPGAQGERRLGDKPMAMDQVHVTSSIANLSNEEWTISNAEHGVVSVDLWLGAALDSHVAELAPLTSQVVEVAYQIWGEDIDAEVRYVRSSLIWLQEAYREAQSYAARTQEARYALLRRLADERVTPSEMAVMLSVDVHVAQRFAGDDKEARIARSMLHQLKNS